MDLAYKIKYINNNKKIIKKKVDLCYKNLNRYDYKKNLKKYHMVINNIMQTN